MANSIHRLRTGRVQKRKFYTFRSCWADPDEFKPLPHVGQYEDLCEQEDRPAPGLTVRTLTQTVDASLFAPVLELDNSKGFPGAPFSEDFLLDFNFGGFAIVTQAFKSLVEDTDPGVHQFVHCQLVWGGAKAPVDVPLHVFICGRIVSLDTTGVEAWGLYSPDAKRFAYPNPDELKHLAALSGRPDVYAALLEFPLWSFGQRPAAKFISDPFLKEAKVRDLKGFEVCTSRSARDVTSVRLGGPISGGSPTSTQPESNSTRGLFKRIFRQ